MSSIDTMPIALTIAHLHSANTLMRPFALSSFLFSLCTMRNCMISKTDSETLCNLSSCEIPFVPSQADMSIVS